MEWFDCSIPLWPPDGKDLKEFDAMQDVFHIQVQYKLFGRDLLRSLCGFSIIHNLSGIVYETEFLLYMMGLEKCQILPPFLVFPPFSR